MSHKERSVRVAGVILGAALIVAGVRSLAADTPKPQATPQPQAAPQPPAGAQKEAAPQMPKPGPEHAVLAREQGTWNATVEIRMGPPGTQPHLSGGIETSKICCGGLWLVKDFKSDPSFPPFQGHGVVGYDPAMKKYISMWVDSEVTHPMMTEGTYDPMGKTMMMRGEAVGMDGKETPGLNITYTRRQ